MMIRSKLLQAKINEADPSRALEITEAAMGAPLAMASAEGEAIMGFIDAAAAIVANLSDDPVELCQIGADLGRVIFATAVILNGTGEKPTWPTRH